MDIETLGAFVRAQRKERRLTQLEVAELADVSDRFLRELEHGKPTAEIGKVMEVLAVLGYDLEPVVHRGDLL
ncbi:helix-turn-helix transcriptional regulator [Corynebacterium coyleae]|uniref:helix-turn-helix transcriptional regulator n=1 Tax=Corynebacterium coyleae TaxID=53374 RepID=UPI002549DD27|nr:helix-turn-helix transcriptional regulator [Corynebacterium coyleae]MDK8241876.1 helix-turn-helix transcriptional regulator [Corynebacterium coyleae]MDK8800085.1 helix-turn-helix transcriptional regulator [Corynebacterium coyleae]